MKTAELKAAVAANEINLNAIAVHFGINRKFKWEDVLYLNSSQLKGIIRDADDKMVYIFHFGSMVFVNFTVHEIRDVLNYLKKLDKSLIVKTALQYTEEYSIEISEGGYQVENERIVIPEDKHFYFEIISMILAKSVAMKKIEMDIDAVFDKVEEIMERLNKGRLNIKDRQLSNLSAKILTFKYNTVSYIMLLDKPEIVWDNTDAEKTYDDLSLLFELEERYERVRHKTETLMDITEMFATLSHAKRGSRLEMMIIILILIEIILMLIFEFAHRVM